MNSSTLSGTFYAIVPSLKARHNSAMPLPSHLSEETLGYRLHTGRELGMMLRHEKPLAIFSDLDGAFPPLILRYLKIFERHVRAGRLVKREYREPFDDRGDRRVLLTILYALPEKA